MPLKKVDLTAPLLPIDFLVSGLFPLGFVSFLGAREGVGKTTLLTGLLWQLSRPHGGTFLEYPVKHGASIYVNTDAPDGESRQVRYWLEKHEAQFPDGDITKIGVFESHDNGLTPADLEEIALQAVRSNAIAIIIDSYMGAFPSQDVNRLEQTMSPMAGLRELAAVTGAAVIVTDHIPKRARGERDGDRGILGSVAKVAQARAVHILTRADPQESNGRNLIRFEVQKSSFAERCEPFGVVITVNDSNGHSAAQLERVELASEQSNTHRAVRAVTIYLQQHIGELIPRKVLIAVAKEAGGFQDRLADDVVRQAVLGFGDRITTKKVAGRGAPISYQLTPLGEAN